MSKLIILRGNSGSGKSTVAQIIAKCSSHKIAHIASDSYRVDMLFPKPVDFTLWYPLVRHNTLYCLKHGYDVILDSIFSATSNNKKLLNEFLDELHPKDNFIFTFDVDFDETVRRHQSRQKRYEFSDKDMRDWYKPIEKLDYNFEFIIPQSKTLEQTVEFIRNTVGI